MRLADAVDKDPDKEGHALFRASVKGVKRLRQHTPPPRPSRVPPVPRKRQHVETPAPEDPCFHESVMETDIGDQPDFARPGLQHGAMRKLRRGQFTLEAKLDLHGMTAATAGRELGAFLVRNLAADARCVLIIHGKGLSTPDRPPVLKSRVNAWLRLHNDVIAFCSAQPRDGGTGALYVLLRKQR
ncbi:MAG: Smr/MutS family protein [Gammaproteobacteria bacterium]|nr:Smr/MutS family protein [Gammaproteobacteria bacterium]